MAPSLLFTQCLQNDFVKPIDRFEPISNRLHVSFSEARRLMGDNPAQGPVARIMKWAHRACDEELALIHLRDWHDPDDPGQKSHLEQFGLHCLQDTEGAEFAFTVDENASSKGVVIDSLTLNDFAGTALVECLSEFADSPRRAGIMGVWTEAKISFLAYELVTRYPRFEVAVCSALTASSSRKHHFEALDQLQRILGIQVIDSVGDFIDYLGGEEQETPLLGLHQKFPEVETSELDLNPTDLDLVRYLFRDCRKVKLKGLSGGFSGNVVAGVQSWDLHGHEEVPHVLKIGSQSEMGRERASFERIQNVLGNNAPQVSDFADQGERGAIKYRYASMGGAGASTFQDEYRKGLELDEVRRVVEIVFGEQLMRFYSAAELETCDLLEHYGFDDRWAPEVRRNVEDILGEPASGRIIRPIPGAEVPNICDFYEKTLAHLPRRPAGRCYQSYVHGDLNAANIILDGHRNVWLIDFFHTRRAHVLMDLIKLENDLLYILTPLHGEEDLYHARTLTDRMMEVRDLAAGLPALTETLPEPFHRAWETLQVLRSFYPRLVGSDRDPFQLWVGLLRYAVHTLSFQQASLLQKKWALYTAGRLVGCITDSVAQSGLLRIDWIDSRWTDGGRLGMTLLPGRRDHGRDLVQDLEVIQQEGIKNVVAALPQEELDQYGVTDLLERYRKQGLRVYHMPVVDQKAASLQDMRAVVGWIEASIDRREPVLVHCVGGLGRSGMIAACYLRQRGASAEEALQEVRRSRSPRAVETAVQEDFVRDFEPEE